MNELQIFNSQEFGDIRTLTIDGEVWFIGKDIATALGYSNTRDALAKHVDNDDKNTVAFHDGTSGNPNQTIINESGLYSLILSSKLESAKRFKHWVTSEVLPSLHKHGAYMTPQTLKQVLLNPDTIIKIATALKEEQNKNKILQAANSSLTVENTIMQPKAEYFDELVDRNLLTGIRETAKELQIKERDFVSFLLDKKYMYRDKKGKLMPYAQHIQDGLFEIKERLNETTDWRGTQTFITPKGRETFRLLCLKTA